MTKIAWEKQYPTGQIYSNGVEMALCSANNEQIGPFVFCKDFFQDAVQSFLNNKPCGQHGYKYDPKLNPPIDLALTRILMANSDDAKFHEKLPIVLDMLNGMERTMGLKLTTGSLASNPPENYPGGVMVLVGDGMWMHSSAALSMYTLIMRNGIVHKIGQGYTETLEAIIKDKVLPAQRHDNLYILHGKVGIDKIIKRGIIPIFGDDMRKNYSEKIQTHSIHHYGGIVAYSSARFKNIFPDWDYPENPSSPPGVCFS